MQREPWVLPPLSVKLPGFSFQLALASPSVLGRLGVFAGSRDLQGTAFNFFIGVACKHGRVELGL